MQTECASCGSKLKPNTPCQVCHKPSPTEFFAGEQQKLEEGLSEQIPETFGRYQIIEKIGQGGMGTVYKAQDPKLDRLVALKIIATDIANPQARQTL